LSALLLQGVEAAGFVLPSDIQESLIPPVLGGKDVLGQARTGTGKTAAFALPMMQDMEPGVLQGVVVVPTRELAAQVAEEFRSLGRFTGLSIATVYGGVPMDRQIVALHGGAAVAVATPGRLLDLMRRRAIDMSAVKFAILDEVDRMLDIGFIDDIRAIMRGLPRKRQTIMVSATLDEPVRKLAQEFTTAPVEIDVSRDELAVGEITQKYCTVGSRGDKHRLLMALIAQDKPESMIVFTNMRVTARKVAEKLRSAGVNAAEIRGDLDQSRREKVMARFRSGETRVLVATDVAARGIDVAGITHIVNYDIPLDAEVYVHRIGRTGRMGASGKAITFVSREEGRQLTEIEKLIDALIEETKYDSFNPSPPREEPITVLPAAKPPKRSMGLGGKFRTRRRRRL